MKQTTVIEQKTGWQPPPDTDFIFNRFDNMFPSENMLLTAHLKDAEYQIPVHFEEKYAKFGLWLSDIPEKAVCEAAKYVFGTRPELRTITFENYLQNVSDTWPAQSSLERNHWSIALPETAEELDGRLSAKKRYNIKREKRLAREQIGEYEILSYPAADVPSEIIDLYFAFKQSGYGIDYHMTAEEYIKRFHVSHVYILKFLESQRIGAIVCSCEQCPNVYLENLTYDPELKKYSLGAILYDEYLKILILKKKRSLYLGYGKQVYKSLYGAQENTTYSGKLYRTRRLYLRSEWIPKQKNRAIRFIKRTIKKLDVLNLRRILR